MSQDGIKTKALPVESVHKLTSADRSIARLLDVPVAREPEGQAEADLVGDSLFELFKAEPELREDVPDARSTNAALFDWLRASPSWNEARNSTSNNLPASIAAASLLWQSLTAEDSIAEALKRQEEANSIKRDAEAKANESAGLEAIADALEAEDGDKMEVMKYRAQAANAKRIAEGLEKNAQERAANAVAKIETARADKMTNAAIGSALKDAAKEARKVDAALSGWGFGSGSDVRTDPRAALEVLKKLNPALVKIAEIAGRARSIALRVKHEKTAEGRIPAEANRTRDPLSIFPSELALLRSDVPDALRLDQELRFLTDGLIGFIEKGDAEKGGTFVAAIDVSGSMQVHAATIDGIAVSREMISKGIVLGIAQAAKAEGRDYILFTFGSDSDPVFAVTSRDDWKKHIEWAEKSRAGGTSFNKAIDESIDRLAALEAIGADVKTADVLFLSDGEARVDPDHAAKWKDAKAKHGARLIYLPSATGFTGEGIIEDLADKVIPARDLGTKSADELTERISNAIF